MKAWWIGLGAGAKAGLALGAAAIVLATAFSGWWLLRGDPAVLFSDLKPQDTALLASELDRLKIPYTIGGDGNTLLVDRSQVHATRMKLMGRELPLNGTVGLELFNNTDFGMTEFAQKINFQRALQGELTRTILAFPEVRDARVHLALPEQGLFKQPSTRPKAAITLTLRDRQLLRAEQVSGIQRLVAAAVPGLAAQEVTLVDQQGVALSRPADEEAGAPGLASRLDLKRDTEAYLARKATTVLERSFGVGRAMASVDVTLNMDQVRVTTEDVIAASDGRGTPTGVLVRERESTRDAPGGDASGAAARAGRGTSTQRDAEYQAGRRVEQVVSQAGSIRRMHVVAVLRESLDVPQQEQVRRLLAAVGASPERGDTVLVQVVADPAAAAASTPTAGPKGASTEAAALAPLPGAEGSPADAALPDAAVRSSGLPPVTEPAFAALAVFATVVAAGLAWAGTQRARRAASSPTALSDHQREEALRRVEAWLLNPPSDASTVPRAMGRQP